VVGLRVPDGVVLAVEKPVLSKLLLPGTSRRIAILDSSHGMASAGLTADARQLVNFARKEANEHRKFYSEDIPARVLIDRLSMHIQNYTIQSYLRPYGVSSLVASHDRNGFHLHMIEPSGVSFGYFGIAVGRGKSLAKTEIEALELKSLNVQQALFEAAKIVHKARDEKDKDFELELACISDGTGHKFQYVSEQQKADINQRAKQALDEQLNV